jgi:hypothetical protein
MESGIQSSFIPRDAAEPQKSRRVGGGGGLGDLLLVLGIVAIAASIALAVAVFLYQQYLNSQSQSDIAQLQRAEAQFEPSLVQQLIRLNDRMQSAQGILAVHIAPSALFDILDQITLKTVSFTSLNFDATDPQQISIKMNGLGQSVNSIALQDDLLSKSGVFTSPIFSNIDRQKDGVHFAVSALVNPAALNFEQLTGGGAPQQQTQTPLVPAQSATPATTPAATTSSAVQPQSPPQQQAGTTSAAQSQP